MISTYCYSLLQYSRIAVGARLFLSNDDGKKATVEKKIRDAARQVGRDVQTPRPFGSLALMWRMRVVLRGLVSPPLPLPKCFFFPGSGRNSKG